MYSSLSSRQGPRVDFLPTNTKILSIYLFDPKLQYFVCITATFSDDEQTAVTHNLIVVFYRKNEKSELGTAVYICCCCVPSFLPSFSNLGKDTKPKILSTQGGKLGDNNGSCNNSRRAHSHTFIRLELTTR